jgi:hypothetical protein
MVTFNLATALDYPQPTNKPPQVVHLQTALTDEETDALAAHKLRADSYDQLFTDDVDIYKPDGSLLCKLRQRALSREDCATVFPFWKEMATPTPYRGTASGIIEGAEEIAQLIKDRCALGVAEIQGMRAKMIKQDGSLSNTYVSKHVNSGIIGYFDRSSRFPYCRLTAYNLAHPDRFRAVLPFLRKIDAAFAHLVPDRYAVQKQFVQETNPDFYIHGTAFTTVTVNRNFQTAVHQDVGDLKAGFGVMSCIRRGRFDGCFFVFPKYRVALDLRTGCVLCADVHEWHANTPFKGNKGMYERISLVLYYREHMKECGSAQHELERAKLRGEFGVDKPHELRNRNPDLQPTGTNSEGRAGLS